VRRFTRFLLVVCLTLPLTAEPLERELREPAIVKRIKSILRIFLPATYDDTWTPPKPKP
jgi:hypothetical protein